LAHYAQHSRTIDEQRRGRREVLGVLLTLRFDLNALRQLESVTQERLDEGGV
jgi:hypothetical protein